MICTDCVDQYPTKLLTILGMTTMAFIYGINLLIVCLNVFAVKSPFELANQPIILKRPQ